MAHSQPFMGTKLQTLQGLPAGLFAGAGMAFVFSLGSALFGPGVLRLWQTAAGTFMGSAATTGSAGVLVGLVIHVIVSLLLGLLYATSMDRLERRDTLVVSLFYGFTIWVVFSFIIGGWINREMVSLSRTWWGLIAYLVFGLLLGVWANLRGRPAVR
ncbi:MAG: hypothetical protein D6775_16605 [Caldilineae bacterium]|nr:MAG: hypothetical protein D6775_16605 [Caldilineae bacterium]